MDLSSPRPRRQLSPNPVVSVRLPKDVDDRLSELSRRTRRSRGVYLREAIIRMLPLFELAYSEQMMERDSLTIDEKFLQIVEDLRRQL